MRSAIEVANWLILNGSGYELSNLKIQKLLFIAFGCHFADHNEHLFYDPIEAWKYGPVVQSVYHSLKVYGPGVIETPIELPDGEVPSVSLDERQVIASLAETLKVFGPKTAFDLVRWTHTKDGPWDKTFEEKKCGLREINKQSIRRFFLKITGSELPTERCAKAVAANGG